MEYHFYSTKPCAESALTAFKRMGYKGYLLSTKTSGSYEVRVWK